MSRAQRLLQLIQLLRGYRFPVAGAQLASSLGISLRTLYRDLGTLKEQGACIEGEPGLGYVLRPGFVLPPMMFSAEEIESLVLGSRWVVQRGDERLSASAQTALEKIAAVLPDDLRHLLDTSGLLVGPAASVRAGELLLPQIRLAIRSGQILEIQYRDLKETKSCRRIWPFALGYFDHVRVVVAWCELRQGFRHFRTDRIENLKDVQERYPRRRQSLLKEWKEMQGIAAQ